ncbi:MULTISPECIES: NAD(P)H-dependent oxidoreductase [Chryseobacterium]|uniref:NAD(P)H dehydrogenase (Quinone) n=1 Tax=Chryseobacterium camelliae TaxID=1265445 RepID=A0ABU0TJQ0_9FLAO|nr:MULTISPECIES: NAD(P)H-dependent oxidoreductase [Chryseobacterium]MDT3409610.1 NAD(P)H dehydrogenase (quinone) [Pseudacidovorax intermedius]MDQ1096530.1 NAD(P)H dehydrogenase (quinone) [Chryseobacterium camelliae]MDQ1100471.1 NAD(P)H dehydrogenase (quinone) [Chryseobacterium sp. SORGH_AS_1048]MDR6087811.1 NAD(P)H dehydrogenase (quinone) [Chryseobacterium sp. SORGH_AS_0909]MDR6132186.1 NAD(P)H dehydrogenase (quinone) [Chryseobacterium sp. SORGH_AS_1175]
MRHLVIYSHPNDQSLNHHLLQTVTEILKAQNQEIRIRDLYELDFNPVLSLQDLKDQRSGQLSQDIREEQEHILWAEHITFIYPIWWTGMPAMMKGFIDRVFSYGFAYRYDQGIQKGLLKGKKTIIINTHGKSKAEYASIGMDQALSLTSDKGIYTYCGLEISQHLFLDRADKATEEMIQEWKRSIKEAYLD